MSDTFADCAEALFDHLHTYLNVRAAARDSATPRRVEEVEREARELALAYVESLSGAVAAVGLDTSPLRRLGVMLSKYDNDGIRSALDDLVVYLAAAGDKIRAALIDRRKAIDATPVVVETTEQETGTPVARLNADLPRSVVTLDGVPYDVKSEQALRWVKVLAVDPGRWISARELAEHDSELDGARTDRLKLQLPESVQALIDSETGRGSRIRL